MTTTKKKKTNDQRQHQVDTSKTLEADFPVHWVRMDCCQVFSFPLFLYIFYKGTDIGLLIGALLGRHPVQLGLTAEYSGEKVNRMAAALGGRKEATDFPWPAPRCSPAVVRETHKKGGGDKNSIDVEMLENKQEGDV